MTGKRGLIDEDTNDILRAAGNLPRRLDLRPAHGARRGRGVLDRAGTLLALVPVLALRAPIKKVAAAFAMVAVTAYCAFSGWDIAAERSLIMTLVMLGATLVDRPALSMRNLALSALIALAREPDGLLGPSFQMSFGAVAGLIAFSRYLSGRWWDAEAQGRVIRAAGFLVASLIGTLATTLVATVATAPFSTYHFQNLQPFGLIGNALTLPLVSLVVMPSAVIGMLAYPFALDPPVWWLMGLAVKGMLAISAWIASFDRATVVVPAFETGVLALFSTAVLLLTLCVSQLRWLGLVPIALGLALMTRTARPDIYIDREGGGAAIRGRDGRLVVLGKVPTFVLGQWLKADGDGRDPDDVAAGDGAAPGAPAAAGVAPSAATRCDRLGCVATAADGTVVALVKDKRAFAEDCERAAIVIARAQAPPNCKAGLVVDRPRLAAGGATTIRLAPDGLVVTSARGPADAEPWIRRAPVPAPAAVVPARRPRATEPEPPEPAPDEPADDQP